MSLAADALQPFFVKGITSVEGRLPGMPLADLIAKQQKIGFDLDFDDTTKSIVTDFRESGPILECIAHDSSRFASASFQSMRTLPDVVAQSGEIAWGMVRSYYAAFYAGHALLRLFGESCSHFDRAHVNTINSLSNAYGKTPAFKIGVGVYHCKIDANATVVSSRSLKENGGGTHEVFWDVFSKSLGTISAQILTGPLSSADSQAVFARIESFRKCISSNGAPLSSWLSVLRNDIQYRHRHDVWLPCGVKKQNREMLGRMVAQWTRDPMNVDIGTASGGKLGEFALGCAFVVSLCRAVMNRLMERFRKTWTASDFAAF